MAAQTSADGQTMTKRDLWLGRCWWRGLRNPSAGSLIPRRKLLKMTHCSTLVLFSGLQVGKNLPTLAGLELEICGPVAVTDHAGRAVQ